MKKHHDGSAIQKKFVLPNAHALLMLALLFFMRSSLPGQHIVTWGGAVGSELTNTPPSATNVIAVAAGNSHSMALRSDGVVIAWGSSAAALVPEHVTNAVAIAAGARHSMALLADGSVAEWGENTGQSNVLADATNVVAIAAGDNHSLALRSDGQVLAWGTNLFGQASVPANLTGVVSITAGAEHSIAIRDNGEVVVWGKGSLYLGEPISPAFRDPLEISAGVAHNLVLNLNGVAVDWRLGLLHPDASLSPPIPRSASNLVRVATRRHNNLALRQDGRIVAWGAAFFATNIPFVVANTACVAIAIGGNHGLAVVGDGTPHIIGGAAYRSRAAIGSPLPLSARVVGQLPLSFQWLADGVPIAGATNAQPQIPTTRNSGSIAYQVVVSNSAGAVTSAVARVKVTSINVWGDSLHRAWAVPDHAGNAVSIAAGPSRFFALNEDGSIVSWGKDYYGETAVPSLASNAVAIAAGGRHALALRTDGTVAGWGLNDDGQVLGFPTVGALNRFAITNGVVSVLGEPLTNVMSVAAGWAHSIALRSDGTVAAWGNNEFAQTEVSFLATDVIAIAAGYYHNLALRSDGNVVAWGWRDTVPETVTNVIAIAAGRDHSLALRRDGSVAAWGDNTFGQSTVPASATNVVAIAAAWYHSMALRADGTVIVWGQNHFGVTNVPFALSNVAGIAIAEDNCMAMVGSGAPRFLPSVASATTHAQGQATLYAAVTGEAPLQMQWYRNGTAVDGATNRVLVLTGVQLSDAGSYVLVATNAHGEAESEPVQLKVIPEPRTIAMIGGWGDASNDKLAIPSGISNPRAVAAGPYHNIVLNGDGTVIAWGKGRDGQTDVGPAATNVIAIAAGYDHGLALRSDGTVAAWGLNEHGQVLGFATKNIFFPGSGNLRVVYYTNGLVTANGVIVSNVTAIAAGWAHSLALREDGTVVAWGNNDFDQLHVPEGISNVIAIAAGYYHSLALRADHTVVAWGFGKPPPPAATNVVAIAGGWNHSLALRADGTVVAWGDNTYGQSAVPASATNVVAVSAGFFHSVALREDGTVIAWGGNYQEALSVPILVDNVIAISAGEGHTLALRQIGPPEIEQRGAQFVRHTGDRLILGTTLKGTQPFAAQWHHDGLPIPGETNRLLHIESLQGDDAGDYMLSVTNVVSIGSSDPAGVVVLPLPAITGPVKHTNALVDAPFCVRAAVAGEEPLEFTWYRNGLAVQNDARISGADSANLCFATATFADSGAYSLAVSNSHGGVNQLIANVVVTPVIAWGDNSFGQTTVPADATNLIALSAGGTHTLGLRGDGTVMAWGDNSSGQVTVPILPAPAVAIAAGRAHSLALLENGKIVGWGDNTHTQIQSALLISGAVAIAAGSTHSVALLSNGIVRAWGDNIGGAGIPVLGSNFVAIGAGEFQSIALRSDGTVASWGPRKLAVPASVTNVIAIRAGDKHNFALRSDGVLIGWGRNFYEELQVPAGLSDDLAAISAGGNHNLGLSSDGTVTSWGADYYGQSDTPPHATNALSVSAGEAHTVALSAAGQPYVQLAALSKIVPAGRPLQLRAAVADDSLSSYQWQLNGMDLAGETNLTLFLPVVHGASAGVYRLIASSARGTHVSGEITVNITRTPLAFEPPALDTNGVWMVRLSGANGTGPVVIDASTNLVEWESIFTNASTVAPIEVSVDAGTNGPAKFFRASEPD